MQLYRVAVAAAANNDGAEKEKKMKGLAGWLAMRNYILSNVWLFEQIADFMHLVLKAVLWRQHRRAHDKL